MGNLNETFTVKRGWKSGADDTCTMTESFVPETSLQTANYLETGEFITLDSAGQAVRGTGVDYAAAGSVAALAALQAQRPQHWMIITGAQPTDIGSTIQTGTINNNVPTYKSFKVVALRGTFIVETTQFVTRAYVKGSSLTIVAGKLDITDGSDNVGYEKVGDVIDYNGTTGVLIASISLQ